MMMLWEGNFKKCSRGEQTQPLVVEIKERRNFGIVTR